MSFDSSDEEYAHDNPDFLAWLQARYRLVGSDDESEISSGIGAIIHNKFFGGRSKAIWRASTNNGQISKISPADLF